MREEARNRLGGIRSAAVLALGAALLLGAGSALAGIKYVGDGAVQNSRGGWDLPKQGACPADLTATTRPECLARRFAAANSAACTALGPAGQYSWSTGICTDLVNTTKTACEASTDRHWNANGSCAIVMADDDRNALVCVKHGGTWVTTGTCTASWVMPSRTDPAYGPGGVLVNDSATGNAGAGDQCLRCHNNRTQYNSPRVRDTEDVFMMGHKNMSRPVSTTFKPWGGPPFSCTGHPSETTEEDCVHAGGTWDPTIYPTDDAGNPINWNTNKVTVGGTAYDLKWIYGDWLAALPRAIYTGSTLNNMSYSCGRCHTTGWTSDAGTTPNAAKHPELDFPGITWNGTGTQGQVKLGGGVAGDPNVMSSWDQWGISCTRCHFSAVDDTTSAPNFAAPAGMSSHHNALTGPNNNSGVCTDVRWSSAPAGSSLEALCASNGGSFLTACSVNPTPNVCTAAANTSAKCSAVPNATWVAAPSGWCSNAFYTTSAACTANSYTWADGWCKMPAGINCTGGTGDAALTLRINGSQASCQVAGATWTLARCSVEGFCSKGTCSNKTSTNAVDCEAAGASWSAIKSKTTCDAVGGTFAYATDVVTCDDAGGRWWGNSSNRGQTITSVCMQCHRQETSGYPDTKGTCSVAGKTTQGACVAGGGTWTDTGDGLPLTVGPAHGNVGFTGHPHSNQFLNSSHARFTGKWSEIATGKFDLSASAKYKSSWMDWGESYGTGNGCTGCHDVHTSIVAGEKPFRVTCNDCHHALTGLDKIQHPKGPGTPFEKIATEPMEACVTCHMPGGLHLFRINTDKAYSTFPMPAALSAGVPASTAPDGTFTNAVWVDIDAACGQCHGGGTANVKTTGTVATGSAALTVASATGLAVGERIRITGAGAFYYDDIGQSGKYNDLDTYVKAIAGNVVTLAGTATKGVTNAVVTQNVTTPESTYMTKAALAGLAKGMHIDPNVMFTAAQGANSLTVAVDASATKCSGDIANCNVFDWNWGDNSLHGSGVKATHAYAAPGTYTITLTVKSSNGSAKATQAFTAKALPGSPTLSASCAPNYPAWAVNCTVDVPSAGYKLVSIKFGDGTISSAANPSAGPLVIAHTYQEPGNYAIEATVVNAADLQAQATIGSMASGIFISEMPTISGKVLNAGQPVGSAQIVILRDGQPVANTMSREDGSYSTGKIRPGTYTLRVTKDGYIFANPFGQYTIGPSITNQNLVTATRGTFGTGSVGR